MPPVHAQEWERLFPQPRPSRWQKLWAFLWDLLRRNLGRGNL